MFEKYRIFLNHNFLVPNERELERRCLERLLLELEERVPWSRVNELVVTVLGLDCMFQCEISVRPWYASPSTDHWQPSTHLEIERTLGNFLQSLTDGDSQAHVDITLQIVVHLTTVSVCMRMPVCDWSDAALKRMLTPIKDQIMNFSQAKEGLPKGTLSLRCEALVIGLGLKSMSSS